MVGFIHYDLFDGSRYLALVEIPVSPLAGYCLWKHFDWNHNIDDDAMKSWKRFYTTVHQIHLYSSLLMVALLVMYIITSYMFMYHDTFKVAKESESSMNVKVLPIEITNENWNSFLNKYEIRGILVRENFKENGDVIRIYARAKGNDKIIIYATKDEVEITSTKLNVSGNMTGLHRLRGYGGALIYNLYAFLLDIVGISLILFAITGVILWLNLLKNNTIAWTILLLGFVYVSAVITYLMIY